MTALTITAAASGGHRKARGCKDFPTDPVRKHSFDINDRRAIPWRPIGNGTLQFGVAFTKALERTARWLFERHYDQGYEGPDRLQRSYVDVLKAALAKLDYATGRMDPSWDTLCAGARCGRGVVDRALAAFHHHGFMSTIRRSVRREGSEGVKGPQRDQISNAAYFDCKARMAPDVFARFWQYLREELGKFGTWAKRQARKILNTFNSEAVPSPREPRLARLVRRAARINAKDGTQSACTQAPVQNPPGRPSNISETVPRTAASSGYIVDTAGDAACRSYLRDILNASSE